MKYTIVMAVLLMTCIVGSAQSSIETKDTLSLTIAPRLTNYVEAESLPVTLSFKNIGKKGTRFLLPGKDEDPPGYISARVWDAQGKLLTANDTLQDGWWTVQVMSSEFYKEKKSDRISLKPGEEFTRTVDLKRLLWGCRGLPEGLRAGQYRVQFSFGKVLSNEFEVIVVRRS